MDWIEEAAKEVHERFQAGTTFDIAAILRQNAPQWRDRPTCAGWWLSIHHSLKKMTPKLQMRSGGLILVSQDDVDNNSFQVAGLRWYGPIPEPPKEGAPQ